MKEQYKSYLFAKRILVCEPGEPRENLAETLFALANLFGIRISFGAELARPSMIKLAAKELGQNVPAAFYRGFPKSVRELSPDKLFFDQLIHYTVTYGWGNFSEAGHSVFEEDFERAAFKEDTPVKNFEILSEDYAVRKLEGFVKDLLASTRPLNVEQYDLAVCFIRDYGYEVQECASKNTAVKLLLDLRDLKLTRFLQLSDVIKLVDELNYRSYGNTDIKKLNLKNQDRKFICAVIDTIIDKGRCDTVNCFEKKRIWAGLLHHIHYKPKTGAAKLFADAMRGDENLSVYSDFEEAMSAGDIRNAVSILRTGKGTTAVLRNLNYIVSRCEDSRQVEELIDGLDTKNVIVLLQLLTEYGKRRKYLGTPEPRTFAFTKYQMLKVHQETEEELKARRSQIGENALLIEDKLRAKLKALLAGRLGKVYIDPDMKNYALPLQETASQGGFGVLAKGTRLPFPEAKKIRAFTYWEKVNDIDLSMFGIDKDGRQFEFSWRSMAGKQSEAITFSGDQTSGYDGGSEFFDIDLELLREQYPDMRQIIFCDNVYSGTGFNNCICRAGYMVRDIDDSGGIFEPKTVRSSFAINCESNFAYLFGIDLEKNCFIWLNMGRSSSEIVAGRSSMAFLTDYFSVTDTINMYSFFEMMASELVSDPAEADIIVTDKDGFPGSDRLIREYDFEKVLALMNK